ncbi:hypothetical protein BpHYR1_015824 [Brachionus plicatilis]|uniref:Uncharacterized protein n=1 Tax=Brachionus plicatilis TaxID=10195 RepID=A0A3M7SPA1_BRAPC|nr:hypothetical protein BpHYR1_015824 [Brachionus plicatilis]
MQKIKIFFQLERIFFIKQIEQNDQIEQVEHVRSIVRRNLMRNTADLNENIKNIYDCPWTIVREGYKTPVLFKIASDSNQFSVENWFFNLIQLI